MSNYHLSRRALIAIMIAPFSALVACASKGAKETTPAPAYSDDTASIANGGGKTMENLFAGRFPGVIVQRAENGGIRIVIRGGISTFSGSNEPLYLVDDVPIEPGPTGLVFLNPYDIQKIEVLKNPEDIGVYGVRGSNGVVKISMKKPGRR